jgi:hypothetical protein
MVLEDLDRHWGASPLKYAKNVRTPRLILGEQWFRALKHYGANAELVVFPRENHNLTRSGQPKHPAECLNWQCYWFNRFLDGNAKAKPPDTF